MGTKFDKRTKVALAQLGERIRKAREIRGVAQAVLAKKIRMEATNLAKIERGARNVTVDSLVRIADGLGITFWDLLKP